MSHTVDREVLGAAQALCMLATGNRQQQDVNTVNKTEEDDDYPVAHRQEDGSRDETEDDDCVIRMSALWSTATTRTGGLSQTRHILQSTALVCYVSLMHLTNGWKEPGAFCPL